nr:membrane-associated phosphatidylinositol transfer protein 1-like [Chelonoidis abingdonii]
MLCSRLPDGSPPCPGQVHGLDTETWKDTEVVHIDIADRTQVSEEDYKADEDLALFTSVKTGRGPFGPDWKVPAAYWLRSGRERGGAGNPDSWVHGAMSAPVCFVTLNTVC